MEEGTIVLTPDEQLAFWRALNEPVVLTEAQRRLGAMMRDQAIRAIPTPAGGDPFLHRKNGEAADETHRS